MFQEKKLELMCFRYKNLISFRNKHTLKRKSFYKNEHIHFTTFPRTSEGKIAIGVKLKESKYQPPT